MREIRTSGSTRGQWVAGKPVAHCPTLLAQSVVRPRLRAISIRVSIGTEGTVDSTTLWTYSLIAGVAVILIVAVLLILIIVTARSIDKHAKNIWIAGKNIAANTVSIWMLQETNAVAGQILAGAGEIVKAARAIDEKLGAVARTLG